VHSSLLSGFCRPARVTTASGCGRYQRACRWPDSPWLLADRAGTPALRVNARRIADHLPLHRLGRPEEVATIAVWLCSDQASFINGATIPIDGGKLAGAAAL
jgi:NAD(P)-dependent dehydrogenase (short-subunit alcohol dehydrogenase family)